MKHPDRKYVSKVLLDRQNGQEEWQNYARLNLISIDPEMNYFIGEAERCELTQEQARMVRKRVDMILDDSYILNYVYGGGPALDVLLKKTDVNLIYVLRGLENIFQGIALLHHHGIYHLDVKEANIIPGGSFAPFRLIDFGLSRTVSNPPTEVTGSLLYMPIEMNFIKSTKISPFIFNIFLKQVFLPNLMTVDLVVDPSTIPGLTSFESLTTLEKYSKVDIWALGIILQRLLPRVNSGVALALHPVIRALLEPNVHMRPDAAQALRLYQQFLIAVNRE
jgi:serine/threonine protein kinase